MADPATLTEIARGNVRAELAYRGMTFAELATATGIPRERLTSRNQGETEYKLSELDSIGEALSIDPQVLTTPRK